jgi:hypothetical protein
VEKLPDAVGSGWRLIYPVAALIDRHYRQPKIRRDNRTNFDIVRVSFMNFGIIPNSAPGRRSDFRHKAAISDFLKLAALYRVAATFSQRMYFDRCKFHLRNAGHDGRMGVALRA